MVVVEKVEPWHCFSRMIRKQENYPATQTLFQFAWFGIYRVMSSPRNDRIKSGTT